MHHYHLVLCKSMSWPIAVAAGKALFSARKETSCIKPLPCLKLLLLSVDSPDESERQEMFSARKETSCIRPLPCLKLLLLSVDSPDESYRQ